jgi:CHAT domain-containing protein
MRYDAETSCRFIRAAEPGISPAQGKVQRGEGGGMNTGCKYLPYPARLVRPTTPYRGARAAIATQLGQIRNASAAQRICETEIPARAFRIDPTAPYAHPLYWAPFVLMGNWP